MTKADFGLMVAPPIIVVALICAYSAAHSATWDDIQRYLLAFLCLSIPMALLFLSGKRGH
jgi:hypothetical protein